MTTSCLATNVSMPSVEDLSRSPPTNGVAPKRGATGLVWPVELDGEMREPVRLVGHKDVHVCLQRVPVLVEREAAAVDVQHVGEARLR